MASTEETLGAMRRKMRTLLESAMEVVLLEARDVLEESKNQYAQKLADVAKERAEGLAEVAKQRAAGLSEVSEVLAQGITEVESRLAEFRREVATMHKHKEAQEGRIELNIGGHRFETSVQTLRRVPYTFFDAYFSGRYAQDVCHDGSIFVDRDGEHFGHVLEYMRDGALAVAEPGARPSVSLLRALKREFGFYCIELCADAHEVAYMFAGWDDDKGALTSMEQYDAISGQWSAMAPMKRARYFFGACVVAGEIYVTGGTGIDNDYDDGALLSSVQKYCPLSKSWISVAPLLSARSGHAAVAVGTAIYVLGGTTLRHHASRTTLKLDTRQGTWNKVTPMPSARSSISACAVGRNIYVFGQATGHNDQRGASVLKYDTEVDQWTKLAPMPSCRIGICACVMDGLVYVIGAGPSNRDCLRFDPVQETWSTLAPTLSERDDGALFVLDGLLYAAGGGWSNPSVERYDAAADAWTAVADMLEARCYSAAVTIGPASSNEDLFDLLIAKAAF